MRGAITRWTTVTSRLRWRRGGDVDADACEGMIHFLAVLSRTRS